MPPNHPYGFKSYIVFSQVRCLSCERSCDTLFGTAFLHIVSCPFVGAQTTTTPLSACSSFTQSPRVPSGAFLGKIMAESATEGMSAYAKAGAIAEEVGLGMRGGGMEVGSNPTAIDR